MRMMAFSKQLTRLRPSCHFLVSGLPRKPFAPSGLLLFREQRVPARGRSSRSTDTSSIFYRLSVTRKEWQGFPHSVCLCSTVVLGHDVDIVSDADRGSRRGMDAVRHCSVSGGRLRCRGTASHDEPNFIAGRPRRPCVTLLFLPGSLEGLPQKKLY